MSEEKSIADRLHALLTERLGSDWRRDISLTLRADALYWFVFLAEYGIGKKREMFQSTGRAGAEEAASLAS